MNVCVFVCLYLLHKARIFAPLRMWARQSSALSLCPVSAVLCIVLYAVFSILVNPFRHCYFRNRRTRMSVRPNQYLTSCRNRSWCGQAEHRVAFGRTQPESQGEGIEARHSMIWAITFPAVDQPSQHGSYDSPPSLGRAADWRVSCFYVCGMIWII